MADRLRRVTAEDWVAEVGSALGEGWVHLDWLGVVDELGRTDELRVVVRLLDVSTADPIRLETTVPRDRPALASLRLVLPGTVWHEREASDMFGIRFDDGDDRPLLVADRGEPGDLLEYPLRKDAVLAARVAIDWPGAAADDTTRRRMPPPGVPDPEVFGDRPAGAAPLDPHSLLGTARRRR